MFDPAYFGVEYFGETFFGAEEEETTPAPPTAPSASGLWYLTPVRHYARVTTVEDGDPVDDWPGSGTLLYANVEQKKPAPRWGQQTEETVTWWDIQFDYTAMVAADVTILRGDRLTITPAFGAAIVLRAIGHATNYNQLGVYFLVPCEQIY